MTFTDDLYGRFDLLIAPYSETAVPREAMVEFADDISSQHGWPDTKARLIEPVDWIEDGAGGYVAWSAVVPRDRSFSVYGVGVDENTKPWPEPIETVRAYRAYYRPPFVVLLSADGYVHYALPATYPPVKGDAMRRLDAWAETLELPVR